CVSLLSLLSSLYTAPAPTEIYTLSLHDALPILTEVVTRSLASDPADRFADAEAFAVALGGAAASAWGPVWMGESGITVVASGPVDRKSTRLNSSHRTISYAVFCLKKKKCEQLE